MFSCYGDESRVREFDPMQDVRANNFIGTRSLVENLQFVPVDVVSNRLREEDRAVLFAGLKSVLPQAHLDAIWSILWQRWNYWREMGGGN